MKRFLRLSILALAVSARASAQTADVGVDNPSKPARWFATFSIIAFDPATNDLGVGVQSHAFTAGAAVPYAIPGVGAVATQAAANRLYGPKAIELLKQGLSPADVVKRLTDEDPGRDTRQLAVRGVGQAVDATESSSAGDLRIEVHRITARLHEFAMRLLFKLGAKFAFLNALDGTRGFLFVLLNGRCELLLQFFQAYALPVGPLGLQSPLFFREILSRAHGFSLQRFQLIAAAMQVGDQPGGFVGLGRKLRPRALNHLLGNAQASRDVDAARSAGDAHHQAIGGTQIYFVEFDRCV
jgi:hypothetical protein